MKKCITIISSSAEDIFIDSEKEIIKKRKGGPAYFIQQALLERGVNFDYIDKWHAKIQLFQTNSGKPNDELFRGRVVGLIPKFNVPTKLTTEYMLISTIADEWNLDAIKNYRGKVFLDIQGYVRNPKKFSEKIKWPAISSLIDYIYCLKGTREEIKFLPRDIIKVAKRKLLIVTNGPNTVKLFYNNKSFRFSVNMVRNNTDTIGAGDTFFAHFIAGLYTGCGIKKSIKMAINKTRIFLMNKIST
jgi:pfkB family carbohydrate kinase